MAVATSTALLAGAAATAGAAALDNRSNRKAVQSAEEQKAASQAFIEGQIKQARGDIFQLFPSSQESIQTGAQQGINMWGRAFPAMLTSFQKGNYAAQDKLYQGVQQANNAILGNPIDYSGLQPTLLRNKDTYVNNLKLPPSIELGGLPAMTAANPAASGMQGRDQLLSGIQSFINTNPNLNWNNWWM